MDCPQRRLAIRVRLPRKEIPILTPDVITDLLDAEAVYSLDDAEWRGDLRYRLLWSSLAETGMRIGEALSLQHRDWCTGRSCAERDSHASWCWRCRECQRYRWV
jgi:integrase